MSTFFFLIALRIMSESSLRTAHSLLPRHIPPGGNLDQFNICLTGHVSALWKNESVSDPLDSSFSCLEGVLSDDFHSKKKYLFLISCK